ncbi:hypothetical protein N1851_015610 [Merluccius polli]|uniref:Ubiquitin-like protease family profile domain-containing protein n=1 Tax=Merluccius polli TaxID=89951 RepID=A0AA47P2K6_MERPO|nr:hypothetical protein N1851_015610 [Merluccius polli]
MGLNPSRWACDTMTHPIQQDATSCGAYALKVHSMIKINVRIEMKFAECILGGFPLEFDNSTSDDLSDLCHSCGEQQGDTLWVTVYVLFFFLKSDLFILKKPKHYLIIIFIYYYFCNLKLCCVWLQPRASANQGP